MLHELLLGLSGHPSMLILNDEALGRTEPLLSPSEKSLLGSIALVGSLHKYLRDAIANFSANHPSTVCRAVSAAIQSSHLSKFQEHILSMERSILQEDSHVVGAYDIVTLSIVAIFFNEWTHILQWLRKLVEFINSGDSNVIGKAGEPKSGPQILDWLRSESLTGYSDIETVALGLIRVGETTWLRQLSSWLLYGRLLNFGAEDFFVQRKTGGGSRDLPTFEINKELLPKFLTESTAKSILFIGKSLNQIHNGNTGRLGGQSVLLGSEITSLCTNHLKELSCLPFPISLSDITQTTGSIRTSLARNILHKLLPRSSILQILSILRNFFLLGRGDFALTLIDTADYCLNRSHLQSINNGNSRESSRHGGIMIKEAELLNVMSKTWTILANRQDSEKGDFANEELDLARELMRLTIKKTLSLEALLRSSTPEEGEIGAARWEDAMFDDVLFSTPVSLAITIPSPIDMFLTKRETDAYSCINAYLLSIRCAHLHLTGLWKLSGLRRASTISPVAIKVKTWPLSDPTRSLYTKRDKVLRSSWALISSVTFFLAELGEYFQGEVLVSSWATFKQWITYPPLIQNTKTPTALEKSHTAARADRLCNAISFTETEDIKLDLLPIQGPPASHDPEVLTVAHRQCLSSLVHELLLGDLKFKRALRGLITRSDHLVALMKRLELVVQSLKGAGDVRSISTMPPQLIQEEDGLLKELKQVEDSLSKDVENLLGRLRAIDAERAVTGSAHLGVESAGAVDTGFAAWRGPGVGRLLMKLDSRR